MFALTPRAETHRALKVQSEKVPTGGWWMTRRDRGLSHERREDIATTLFKVIGVAAANPPNEGTTLRANRASPDARLATPVTPVTSASTV